MTSTIVTPPAHMPAPAPRRQVGAVVSAHGGSAASTIAALLRWPEASATPELAVQRVIVTARTTATGLDGVLATVQRLPADVPALLVLSADAPLPMPPAARGTLRLVKAKFVLGIIALPYVPSWRYKSPRADTASKRWIKAAHEIPAAARLGGNPTTERN